MILPRQRDILSSILKNKIKAFVFLFFYTLSLYLILRGGVFFNILLLPLIQVIVMNAL
jgi:hypothetical protein